MSLKDFIFPVYVYETTIKEIKLLSQNAKSEIFGYLIGNILKWKGKVYVLIEESVFLLGAIYSDKFNTSQIEGTAGMYQKKFQRIKKKKSNENLRVIGWWHSHPGFKVMMSHIDIRTTLSYQQNNPLAISLVFNPQRIIRQIEVASKKGDPDIQLTHDPGFKIFRLDSVDSGIEASIHTVDYKIEGYENMEQLVSLTQKFIVDVTMLLPKVNLIQKYGGNPEINSAKDLQKKFVFRDFRHFLDLWF